MGALGNRRGSSGQCSIDRDKRRIYGLLPDVSKKITSWSRSKSDAVIYAACDEAIRASGHHGIRAPIANQ
jgi:hypothetical protein